jgi:hypothetical protein
MDGHDWPRILDDEKLPKSSILDSEIFCNWPFLELVRPFFAPVAVDFMLILALRLLAKCGYGPA